MRKGKSYFYKFLVNFIITLFIPFLMILFMYIQTESTTRRQILLTEERTLEQFGYLFDTVAEEMRAACLSLIDSPECQTYAVYAADYPRKTTYQGLRVANSMDSLIRNQYYDIFVYYPYADRIISGKYASLNTEYYYSTYYCTYKQQRAGVDFRDEFLSVISSDSSRPTFRVIGAQTGKPYLCMTMKQMKYKRPELNFIAVVILKPDLISNLWEKGDVESTSSVVMLNDDGSFLLSAGEDFNGYRLQDTARLGAAYPVEYQSTSYMTQAIRSDITKNYYAFMIPVNYFWRQLTFLRLWCGLGCVACVAASLLIAYRSTLRTYQPVEAIVDELENETGVSYDKNKRSEFEFISWRFSEERSEKKQLAENVKKGTDIRRERFLLALLYGTPPDDAEKISPKTGVSFISDRFCVCNMEIRHQSELSADLRRFILRNVFEELSEQAGQGYMVRTSEHRYGLLCCMKEGASSEDLPPLLARGRDFVREHYHIETTIGISDIHQGCEGIAAAYAEAQEALNYRYLMGRGSLIEYRQIRGRQFRFEEASNSRIYRIMADYLQDASRAPSDVFIKEVLDFFQIDRTISMETMERFRFEVLNALNTLLISNHCPMQTQRELMLRLLSADTLEEFQRDLGMITEELVHRGEELNPSQDVCERAKRLVAVDYSDPQLSVAILAERLSVSPNYLSRLFKKKYDTILSDYISMTRVAKARELLAQAETSIQDIALQTGFYSSNVFIKTFKKWEGMTPGAYRKVINCPSDTQIDHQA